MEATTYLRQKMESLLRGPQTAHPPIDLMCSRHELRGAVRALEHFRLLASEDAEQLLAEYDGRLREEGLISEVSATLGASTSPGSLRAEGRREARATSALEQPRLQAVLPVARPMGRVEGASLTVLSLELWSNTVVLVFHAELDETAEHPRGVQRLTWQAHDDVGNHYDMVRRHGGGAVGGLRGDVHFAGPLATDATQLVVRAAGDTTASVSIDLDPGGQ